MNPPGTPPAGRVTMDSIPGSPGEQEACKTDSIPGSPGEQEACETDSIPGSPGEQEACETDSIPESPAEQESCKTDCHVRILQATELYNTPPQAVWQRFHRERLMNAPNKIRTIRSARGYNCESIETELEEEDMIVFRSNRTRFTRSRSAIENPKEQLGISQEDQQVEIQPVSSSTPHEAISPHPYKTRIFPKLDSSCWSKYNRSSCASFGTVDPDSELYETNGVASSMNMIHVSSPARFSPINILPGQAETHEKPETNFMTPANSLQNPDNKSVRKSILKSGGSANGNPGNSFRKSFDPSMPQKRISFSTPTCRSPREELHEESKKKKARTSEPELNLNKCRPLSERLQNLEFPPEMRMDPAYTTIAEDIASDSYWVNVTSRLRRPPALKQRIQEIKKIRKERKKPKKKRE